MDGSISRSWSSDSVINISDVDCGYNVGDPVDDPKQIPETLSHMVDYPFSEEDLGSLSVVFKVVMNVVVMVIALLGNILVLVTVMSTKHMRNQTNFFLCNLAVSDIIVAGICMWVHLGESIIRDWPFGSILCVLVPFLRIMALTSSVLFLLLISGDRFAAIFFPLRHIKKNVPTQTPYVAMTVAWILSIVVAIPNLLIRKMYEIQWKDHDQVWCAEEWPRYFAGYDVVNRRCLYSYPERSAYYISLVVLMYILPVLGMIMAYTAIIKRLWRRNIPGETMEKHRSLKLKSRKKVIRMLVTVLVVFIICWTPQQIMVLYSAVCPDCYNQLSNVEVYPMIFLAYTNSALNPLIYGGLNTNLRRRAVVLLRKVCFLCSASHKISPIDGARQTYNVDTCPTPAVIALTPE